MLFRRREQYPEAHLSFSQAGEDVIIGSIFEGLRRPQPTYLDIGSNDPIKFNNTFSLYRGGSSGVCVEPNPTLVAQSRRVRPRDTYLQAGVGLKKATADFFLLSPHTLSTFSQADAERLSAQLGARLIDRLTVPVLTLTDLIQEHFSAIPDLVSIDVEGLDFEILKTLDFQRSRPTVWCIETLTYSTTNQERKLTEIIAYMQQRDYFVYADTYINTIFVEQSAWRNR